MDAGVLFPVAVTILVTVVIVLRHADTVERLYNTFEYLRRLIGAVLVVLVAWTFLRSGDILLFLIALALIAFATIWFAIERPDKDIV